MWDNAKVFMGRVPPLPTGSTAYALKEQTVHTSTVVQFGYMTTTIFDNFMLTQTRLMSRHSKTAAVQYPATGSPHIRVHCSVCITHYIIGLYCCEPGRYWHWVYVPFLKMFLHGTFLERMCKGLWVGWSKLHFCTCYGSDTIVQDTIPPWRRRA